MESMQNIQGIQAVLIGPMGRVPLGTTRFTIGRAPDNQLVLSNDLKVSSHHAEIHLEGQNHTIVDQGSTNHTFVNEYELFQHSPHLLRHGDIIRFGDTKFIYEVMNPFQNQPPVPGGFTVQGDAGSMGPGGSMGPVGRVGGVAEQFGTSYGGITDADETYLKPQNPFVIPPQPQMQPPAYPSMPSTQNIQNQQN